MYYNTSKARQMSGTSSYGPSSDGTAPRSGGIHGNLQQQPVRASTSSGNFNLAESGIYSSTHSNQPQQQTQQPIPNYWNPAAAAVMNAAAGGMITNDAMLDLASSAGRTFIASGTARFVPGLERFMTNLRTYFAVDNRYVQRKMITVLFPFLKKQWRRTVRLLPFSCAKWFSNAQKYHLSNLSLLSSFVLLIRS
jgi:hypothetical protein